MADIQVNTVLICDDVRREINNKDILIGVYAGDMNVANLPATVLLSLWMELTSKKKGPYEMTIRIQAPNPEHKFEVKVSGEAPEAKTPFPIFTPQVPYLIDQAGPLKIYAKFSGSDRFELIKTQQIKYIPPQTEQIKVNPSPTS